MPDADALAGLPDRGDTRAEGGDAACHLVARHARRPERRIRPWMSARSAPQIPQASTAIRTSPAPGRGVSRSANARVPGVVTCMAR
ncbi:MAG TPA: hypothetical protein VHL98_05965 [Microvirga sp.]|nr:hypothetical protein [Microvirga sp.]